MPKTKQADLKALRLPHDFEHDPHFLKLMVKDERGQCLSAITRLPIDQITRGFYRFADGQPSLISNLDRRHVDLCIGMIRAGHRPMVSVYWSPLCPAESKLVCPDSEAPLAAYRELSFTYAPCLVVDAKDIVRPHGSIYVRKGPHSIRFIRASASNQEQALMVGFPAGATFKEQMAELSSLCARAASAVDAFHVSAPDAPHYHDMLLALIKRHVATLDSVEALVEAGRAEHASALVRMAYEAFLAFYIDWLSPDFFGPRLQMASALAGLGRKGGSQHPEEAETARRALGGFENLLTSVVDKARISPLGESFYDIAYSPLSWIAHQAYGLIGAEAENLDGTATGAALAKSLAEWLNAITCAMVELILVDVAKPSLRAVVA